MAPHPLRRPSTGSLSSLARSQDRAHSSPSGLDFLTPALTELSDEASTLSSNIAHLNQLHDALGIFNEAFGGWMYALKMNAFCVEWPLAPDQNSVARLPFLTRESCAASIVRV
jgi:DASH complex subunit DAM1